MNFDDTTPYDILTEKWEPVLSHDALPRIEDTYKSKVTAVLLENQEQAMRAQRLTEDNTLGGPISNVFGGASNNIAGYDPILISLVRRAMPNLMAYDICGVQPMTAPTGLIFAMRPKYDPELAPTPLRREAMFQEPFVPFGGSGGTAGYGGYMDGVSYSTTYGLSLFSGTSGATKNSFYSNDFKGLLVGQAEGLGGGAGARQFGEMAFTIDKVAVQAKTRALKADYTTELAQDLKAVHGLDAETELANILSTEILAEINREVVRGIYHVAKVGAQQNDLQAMGTGSSALGGQYDLLLDSDGRWSAERFRGLMFQIEREANQIAKETRRGKGNFIICSSDVASALAMGGWLNISPALNNQLEIDDTGNTFAGVLNGKMRVYIDPYVQSGVDFVCVGYRGASPYDAGLFYCPYVPLQMVRAVDPNTFQPKIGFKTRYGMVANPFVINTTTGAPDGETMSQSANQYYRIFRVINLHGNTN